MSPTSILTSACLLAATQAQAYTVSSPVSAGCHEQITSQALRTVRLDTPSAAPLPASRDEQALIDDLQFVPDADMGDLGAASLLVGARDNDLKGRSSLDLTQLTFVHGDPSAQREHCLRDLNQGEPDGTRAATAACHAYILERFAVALGGLDAQGKPDPARRTSLPLFLSLRHRVDASLPTFYVALGQALHAVEDSFTHTYRTSDQLGITATLDWLHTASGTLDEATQGPPHLAELDRCDDPDAERAHRRALATSAAEALLRLALAADLTPEQKQGAASQVLDGSLGYVPGCTYANGWCDAPERLLPRPLGSGCGAGEPGAWPGWLLLLVLPVLLQRGGRGRTRGRLAPLVAASLLGGFAARAEGPPPPTVVPVKEPGPRDPSALAFGAYLGVSGAFDNPAAAGQLGLRLRVAKNWTLGVDGEWNPWLSFNGRTFTPGVASVYATAILRLPLAYEQFNLRTTLNAGVSWLLMDLYGAPAGSVGLYLGLSPLGLEWKLSRYFFLVVNPLNFALPVPHLTGVPLAYPQYRVSIGLEVSTG
jgi:hypothetical protein